jgi:hypothetical protein
MVVDTVQYGTISAKTHSGVLPGGSVVPQVCDFNSSKRSQLSREIRSPRPFTHSHAED